MSSEICAEAVVTITSDHVVKQRVRKGYRLDSIDTRLRGTRTRREAKVLTMLHEAGFPVPKVIESDGKMRLVIEHVQGRPLRETLERLDPKKTGAEIGRRIAQMHEKDVIHGDLTTSNIIDTGRLLVFIDFGLSFFSRREEDKAVDLHVLEEALQATHPDVAKDCMGAVIKAYPDRGVLQRLDVVRSRGRNKSK